MFEAFVAVQRRFFTHQRQNTTHAALFFCPQAPPAQFFASGVSRYGYLLTIRRFYDGM